MKLTIFIAATALSILGVCALAAYAQPSPKPTPSITSNWCINNTSGATRVVLSKNGKLQACHKGEQLVPIISLDSAPAQPAPSAAPSSDPSATATVAPTPTPDPTATATPAPSQSNCTDCVIDANGNEVGPLEVINAPYDEVVLEIIGGVAMELEVSPVGFVSQYSQQNIDMVLYYPTADCSGQGYLALYDQGGSEQNIQPIVQLNYAEGSPYVYNNVVWYAQPPYSSLTMNSLQGYGDPTQPSITGCETPRGEANYGTLLVGPPASFNLNSLGLTPPFSVQR
jgi:hypothetical protein